MSWLLFYFLGAAYFAGMVWVGFLRQDFRKRCMYWILLSLVPSTYCWGFFAIQMEHAKLCASEGGLKILTYPEKAVAVRFLGDDFVELKAEATLLRFYPQAQLVEVQTNERGGDGKRLSYYVGFSATENQHAGEINLQTKKKEPAYILKRERVRDLAVDLYEIGKTERKIPNGWQTVFFLQKNGITFAKYTEFSHAWDGIQYPDSSVNWYCPLAGQNGLPLNDSNTRRRSSISFSLPDVALLSLIFN